MASWGSAFYRGDLLMASWGPAFYRGEVCNGFGCDFFENIFFYMDCFLMLGFLLVFLDVVTWFYGVLRFVFSGVFADGRWNEQRLKEMAAENDTTSFQKRAGRLAKWRELAEQAAAERMPKLQVPQGVEILDLE